MSTWVGPAAAELGGLFPQLEGDPQPQARNAGVDGTLRLFESVVMLLSALGDGGPLLFIIEDLQWSDPATRDLVDYLARRAPSLPLLLLATYRSDELHRRHPLRSTVHGWRRGGLAEFVELARSKPGQLNFGNPGTGSSIDLTAQKLFQVAGIKLANIGYKGQPPALVDLMTNLMHFEIVSLALALPHIKNGSIKPLAVFTEKRVPDLPDVPTIAEAGYAEAAYVPWYGIYVPATTPDALVEKIHEGIDKALQNPDVQRQLSVADIPGRPMPLSDLASLMKADYEKLTTVVKASGIPPQ